MIHSRKSRSRTTMVAALLWLPLMAAGCGNDPGGSSEDDDTFTIGFANPYGAVPVLQVLQDSVVAYGEQRGMEVITLDDQLDPNKQVTNVNQFVAQHVDAIIVFPLSQDSLTPALNRARDAGIKVIGIAAELDPNQKDIEPYDVNLDQGGILQGAALNAKLVAEKLDCTGNVLGIGTGAPVPALVLQLEEAEAQLKELCPDITWLDTVPDSTDDIAGGQKAMQAALTRFNGDIQAVIAYTDEAGLGAVAAVKQAGETMPVITAWNGGPAAVASVRSGDMTGTINMVPWRLGMIAVTLAERLIRDESVPTWIANPVEQVTGESLDEHLAWDDAVSKIKSGDLDCVSAGCPDVLLD